MFWNKKKTVRVVFVDAATGATFAKTDSPPEQLPESFEAHTGPLVSHLTPARKREIEAMARATLREMRAKISLRVPAADLARLKLRAAAEGMPYQTLINSLIHKYVSG